MGCTPSKSSSAVVLESQTIRSSNQNVKQSNGNPVGDSGQKESEADLPVNQQHSTLKAKAMDTAEQINQSALEADLKDNDKNPALQQDDNEEEFQGNDQSETSGASDSKPKAPKKVYTEEEILEMKQDSLDKAKDLWKMFSDGTPFKDENGEYTKHFRVVVYKTFMFHFALKGVPRAANDAYKREFYTLFVEMQVAKALCDAVSYVLKHGFRNSEGEVEDIFKLLTNSFGVLTNFTDNSINRTDILMNHSEIMPIFAKALVDYKDDYFNAETVDTQTKRVISSTLAITHNVAMHDENISKLRQMNYVEVLKPYLQSKNGTHRMTSLAALADIIDEEESEIIQADRRAIKFIISALNKAMVAKQRRMHGWSTSEIARTLRRIGRNDANKRALVECEVFPSLVKLAGFEDVIEQREAVGTLRTLSFDKDNMDDMINDNECCPVDTLIRLRNSPDKEVRKSCTGALWTMRQKLAESEKYKDIGNEFLNSGVSLSPERQISKSTGHIMLSYQWAYQTVVKSICENLRGSGYKVWMDIDDMEGSTIDAMANAVEQAEIVLVCFSQNYKDSDNCRAEAEYAFQKKKKIIPLKMERDYRADGWLGFIIGAKLFFDFGGKYSFESRMDGLLKELKAKTGGDSVEGLIEAEKATPVMSEKAVVMTSSQEVSSVRRPPVEPAANSEAVQKWTSQQVTAWLTKHNIPVNRFTSLTGMEVAFLQLLMVECPDFFYKTITETMGVKDLLTMSRLRFALNDTNI